MRISDWSSVVCSSDLLGAALLEPGEPLGFDEQRPVHALDERAERLVVGLDVADLEDEIFSRREIDQPVCLLQGAGDGQFGRGSCRERGCQYVEVSGGALSLIKKKLTEN